MSRSKDCERCATLEADVKQWRDAYKELALAVARREGYPVTPVPAVKGDMINFTVTPALPVTVLAAIEETTPAFSDARTAAIEAARGLLENGAPADDVEQQIRQGDQIVV